MILKPGSGSVLFDIRDEDVVAVLRFIEDFAGHRKVVRKSNALVNSDTIKIIDRAFVCYKQVDFSLYGEPSRFLDVLRKVSGDKKLQPKYYNVELISQNEFKVIINDLSLIDGQVDTLIPEKKKRKLTKGNINGISVENIGNPEKLTLRKMINLKNYYDFFELDLFKLLPNKKNQTFTSQIALELQFLQLSPSVSKRNPNLVVVHPYLELHIKCSKNTSHIDVQMACKYSVQVKEMFEDFFSPEVVGLLNQLVLNTGEFSRIMPIPTYYQLGYEFLNQWNPAHINGVDVEQFEKYYGDLITGKKYGLCKKIRQTLANINSPGTKLFYNLLTEYTAKLKASPLLLKKLPKSFDDKNINGDLKTRGSMLISGLKTRLFNFQEETLLWCLDKENVHYDYTDGTVTNRPYFDIDLFQRPKTSMLKSEHDYLYNYNYLSKKIDKIVFGWVRVGIDYDASAPEYRYELLDLKDHYEEIVPSKVYWFNKYTGNIISTRALLQYLQTNFGSTLPSYNQKSLQLGNKELELIYTKPSYFAQNLLSEEMGLGKTIELLALVLTNQRKDYKPVAINKDTTASLIDDDNYVYDINSNRYVLKSKTTLIVCPDSILNQWIQEMHKFAPSLKILKYEGHNQFFRKLASQNSKRKPKKFVIRLKFNKEKFVGKVKDINIQLLTSFSSFKPNNDLSFASITHNSNSLSTSKLEKLPNVKIRMIKIANNILQIPIIEGVDAFGNENGAVEDTEVHELDSEEVFDMMKKDTMKNIESNHKRVAFELSQYDIIVASYQVVTRELHYAQFNPNGRPTRAAVKKVNYCSDDSDSIQAHGLKLSTKRHDYSSPLVLLQFWRIMLDEVQMVSSELSNAAKTCKIFARCHAWGISGTPIKKDLNDIMSYISFLRISPFDYSSLKVLWNRLLNEKAPCLDFMKLIVNLAIRHDKIMVKNDIRLPQQSRVLITSTFSAVEQDNYLAIFKDFLSEAGLNWQGEPIVDDWTPNPQLMRKYLTVLRKICCHIDLASKKIFRYAGASVSMNDILKRLLAEAKAKINDFEKERISLRVEYGEIREFLKQPYEFKAVLQEDVGFVKLKIKYFEEEIQADSKSKIEEIDNESDSEEEDEGGDTKASKRVRLRGWLETLHKYYFFIANAHFQISEQCKPNVDEKDLAKKVDSSIKASEELDVETNSDAYDTLLKDDELRRYLKNKVLENHYYKQAEDLRDKMLSGYANRAIATMTTYSSQRGNLKVDKIHVKDIAPRQLKKVSNTDLKVFYYKLFKVVDELNLQAVKLNKWLAELATILFTPLLAKTDDEGEEYGNSIIGQEKAVYYLTALEVALKFRSTLIKGFSNLIGNFTIETVSFDQKTFDEADKEEEINEELELFKEHLKTEVEEIRPTICQEGATNEYCLKTLSVEAKLLERDIGTRTLLTVEIDAIQHSIHTLQKLFNSESKALNTLNKKGLHMLNALYNCRTVYFKQLQAISDTVQSTDFTKYSFVGKDFSKLLLEEKRAQLQKVEHHVIKRRIEEIQLRVSQLQSRCLYLSSLQDQEDSKAVQKEKICVICQSAIIVGVLTECGHHYCKDCLEVWMKRHHNCPICKSQINKKSIYEFTYTKQNLEIGLIRDQALEPNISLKQDGKKFLFYKPVNDKEFSTINETALASRNKFGAKINTILKIIKWLKNNNSEVQIVIFSQWEDFLRIIAVALEENGIKFLGAKSAAEERYYHRKTKKTTTGGNSRKMLVEDINKFKYDSSITCFLLNAQQQAAGLTLVNATHVILCEPLVNTAIELQAINRIHRIGQKHKTTVWMVGISGSIEESIINLSTKKRINQLSKIQKNEDEMSSHFMNFVGGMSEAKREDNQLAVDSADLMNETDKLLDKSGGEHVLVDELWESFFSTKLPNK